MVGEGCSEWMRREIEMRMDMSHLVQRDAGMVSLQDRMLKKGPVHQVIGIDKIKRDRGERLQVGIGEDCIDEIQGLVDRARVEDARKDLSKVAPEEWGFERSERDGGGVRSEVLEQCRLEVVIGRKARRRGIEQAELGAVSPKQRNQLRGALIKQGLKCRREFRV